MSAKKFFILRMVMAMILSGVISASSVAGNYYIPLAAIITTVVIIQIAKKNVNEVLHDERDYDIAGKAARYSLGIFSGVIGLAVMILFALRAENANFELIGSILAYIVCGLLLVYSLIFKILQGKENFKTKNFLIIIMAAAIFSFAIVGLRIFSGEDGWICKNGEWQKHGNPDAPAPTEICGEENSSEVVSYADGQIISWAEAEGLIKRCEVEKVFQSHSLDVSIELKNGMRVETIEPKIDEIFNIVSFSKSECGIIQMATE